MPGADKIRVLIADDIAETRENIRKLMQFEGDVEVVGAARTGNEAINLAVETKPDVIIMDINMPDMDGIQATEIIRRKVPHSQVIILSVQGEQNYMRRAMLVGARDFLTKPPMIDELSAAIHRAGAMAREEKTKVQMAVSADPVMGNTPISSGSLRNGKIIVVYSPKGGSGCTTIATNLAVGLREGEAKVALVDGNLQYGDIAVFLNVQGRNSILDLATRVDELDPDIVDEVMISNASTGIHLLVASQHPEMAEKVSGEDFAKILMYLKTIYDYIVVDTSSYLTDIVLTAMDNSHLIVLITTQDIPAIKNAKSYLNLADAFQFGKKRVLLVMNRYDKRISIAPEKVGESLRHEISMVIPLDERTVVNAVNRGIPFMVDNRTQPVARSIQELKDLIKERLEKTEVVELQKVGRR